MHRGNVSIIGRGEIGFCSDSKKEAFFDTMLLLYCRSKPWRMKMMKMMTRFLRRASKKIRNVISILGI